MYSAVQDKSANYTVVAGDAGDLIRVTTTSGAVTITLPTISTVSDGFKIAIVKWTGDANAVTVARSSTNTINGATSVTIGAQYSSTIFVADFETNQWFAASSGLGATNIAVDAFSGNNSTVAFTLSADPGSENNTQVYVSGVYQEKDTYSVSGTTLTFSTAPPIGTSNIEVLSSAPLAIGTPSDGTVTTAKLASTTGSGAVVLATSPTITTPVISSLSSASATALTLQSAGTTAVTIDTSQNVGINNTSPSTYANSQGVTLVAGTSPNFVTIQGRTDGPSGASNSVSYGGSYGSNPINGARMFIGAAGAAGQSGLITFCTKALDDNTTQPVERARVDASGRVCIGVTSAAYSSSCVMNVNVDTISSGGGAWVSKCAGTGTVFHLNFQNGNGGVGGISTSASATQYVTSSDYRLKENITPMTGALAKVAQLKPVTFKWKVDGSNSEGFIAHELAEVKPDCVSGEKDAVDADGNPKYQGIDVSFLVATLTAAIQELKAINDTQAETINALTARIVALEK
jgi:hypothetical protein